MLGRTADVGFELGASTLEGLFEEARRALLMVAFERPPREAGEDEREIELSAPERETLLVRWPNEVVYLVQDAGFVPTRGRVRLRETEGAGLSLGASLAGAPVLPEEHGWQGEIKSATFHELDVSRDREGWHARVILGV